MEPLLPQQFIIDYLHKMGAQVPNTFFDPYLGLKLEGKGFELPSEKVYERYVSGMSSRYPSKNIVPFAKSKTDDDTIGFLVTEMGSPRVIKFHDFSDSSTDSPRHFDSLSDWLSSEL